MSIDNDEKKHFEDEVLRTMASLDDLPHLEAGPDFHIRLNQRLAQFETTQRKSVTSLTWWARRLGPAFLIAMIGANFATIYLAVKARPDTSYRDQCLTSIADQYCPSAGNPFWEIGDR